MKSVPLFASAKYNAVTAVIALTLSGVLTACGGSRSGSPSSTSGGGGMPRPGSGGAITALTISPDAQGLESAGTLTFSATGGVEPYVFSISSGGGTIDADTGAFVAPAGPATVEVLVTDALGGESTAAIQVAAVLLLTPSPAYVVMNGSVSLSASGGLPPLNFSLVSGAGSAAGSSYSAPAAPGSATMRVTDSLGTYADATVTTVTLVTIAPATATVAVNNTANFTASGGLAPYAYSIVSGGGSISTVTGVYTAGSSPGSATVRVTDALGQTSDATVTINAALAISPAGANVVQNGSLAFSATGGLGPYTYAVVSGTGSVNSSTGAYTAPGTAGSETVRVTDSLGNTADASIAVVAPVSISPATITLAPNGAQTFAATGGVTPYVFSIQSGVGSVNSSTGAYTAPAAAGSATVRVTDALGQFSDAAVTVAPPLAISPTNTNVVQGGSATFTGSGGQAPLVYSVASGGGSVDPSTGVYTAPGSAGAAVVRVADALGQTADANVTVVGPVVISPASAALVVNGLESFSASGGLAPYVYSVVSGGGSINSSSGAYTAPASAGAVTVRVTDALSQTSDATLTVVAVLAISPTTANVVANGSLSFSASGGQAPLVYSVQSGGGSIDASTGAYTAPASAGSVVVRVSDAIGQTADANVTVVAALSITPVSFTLAVGNSTTFSGSAGLAPYVYSVAAGGGSINSSTGAYTAPGSAGSATIRVTDALGQTADAAVTITAALAISPSSTNVVLSGSATFAGANGVPPYSYSVQSGGGSVNSSTGAYTAPGSAGSATVRVTDALANTADATVTVVGPVVIAPASATLAVNNATSFSASGGATPYVYSLPAGSGSINSSTGAYTAPASAGSATVRVTDALGQTSDASVTINAALAIAPASADLIYSGAQTFSATGGVGAYTFSVLSGGGSVNASTGAYTAPTSAGSVTVRVTDSLANTADATVTVFAPVVISPATLTLAVSNSHTFTASGGKTPYVYSVVSGGGSVNSSTGAYTAPATAGSATVRVTDALGQTSDATVTINAALAITPTSLNVVQSGTHSFSNSGGVGTKTYSIAAGGGSINSSSGAFTAPASAGSVTVRVTDSLANTADSAVTVVAPVVISPATLTLAVNNTHTFTATGGQTPYTYSILSGGGSINSSTGAFTAPASAGSVTVRVTDALSQTSDATVTVNAALAISPSSTDVVRNGSVSFSSTGGVGTKTYSLVSGGASVNSSTGVYTAAASAGSATVRVTDSLGNTADAAVTIVSAVVISPASLTLAVNNTSTFTASGGLGPYTYSIVSGGGSMNSSTGAFTAPASAGTVTVRVTDNLSQTSDATVTVNAALAISPATLDIVRSGTQTFTSTGGAGTKTYSVAAGGGSINSSTGAYTAPATAGSATIRVTDGFGNTSDSAVTIVSAVAISPTSVTLAVNNTQTFTGSGGLAPYSFSRTSGTGSVNSSTGVYTAPASAGSANIRVTDALGQTANATVTVNAALAISPTSADLQANGAQTFSSSGGVAPRTYSVVSGGGSINSSTGAYTAPASASTVTVRVTDALSNTADATVSVYDTLVISPVTVTVGDGNSQTFGATGGDGSYTYSLSSGTGSVDPVTGEYTANGVGTDEVLVTDGVGFTATATVTVVALPVISPSSLTLVVNANQSFTTSGGVSPLTYSLVSGAGTIDSGTGNYTAPAAAGSDVVRVTDALGNTSDATITIVAGLTINPASRSMVVNRSATPNFSAVGGLAPYTFSIVSGGGSIDGSTGAFTAPGTAQTVTVRVTDSLMNTSDSTVEVVTPVRVYSGPAAAVTCMKFSNAKIKCWGANGSGRLGQGNTSNRGDAANELGEYLPYIDLGTGFDVDHVSVGGSHVCAVSTGGVLKCWGGNTSGQLGLGDTSARGDGAGEMGNALPAVDVGSGRTVLQVSAGQSHTCALLDDSTIKCWGLNSGGQLGQGNTTMRGDGAGEMGDALAVTSLSTTATPTGVYAGFAHACATLSNGTLKCWGTGTNGRLGQGSTTSRGDGAGEMGNALAVSDMGTGLTPDFVVPANNFTCARLTGNVAKCWGRNNAGQLLKGSTTTLGDGAGEMGNSLTVMNLGTGRTVIELQSGSAFSCARLDDNSVKCWGAATNGALGNGSTTVHLGDSAGELGNSLPVVSLGTSQAISNIAVGSAHTCALFTDHTLKCWGLNTSGQLGVGDASSRGDAAGEMGTSLPFVLF